MLTRLIETEDGSYNVQWSDDQGKTWHDEIHRKLFVKKLAESFVKKLYPKARFIGTMKA